MTKDSDNNDDFFEQQVRAFMDRRDADEKTADGFGVVADGGAEGGAPSEMDGLWESIQLLGEQSFPELDAYDAKIRDSNIRSKPDNAAAAAQTAVILKLQPRKGATVYKALVSIAASVLVCSVLFLSYFGISQTYEIERGKQQLVSLRDGSELTLQGGSLLTVHEGWGRRRVELERGYVFFSVAKNKDKPFIIDSGSSNVRVLGTAFSVYRNSRKLEVRVESGSVAVESANDRRADFKVVLGKNDKLVLNAALESVPDIQHNVDPVVEFSWRRGEVFFSDETLEDIVGRMSDFYDEPVQIVDASQRKIRLTGNYSLTDFDGFLKALSLAANLRIEESPNGAILIH